MCDRKIFSLPSEKNSEKIVKKIVCDRGLRRRFEEQFADFAGRTYIGDTGAFYFDNIGAEDVKLFLLKQTNISFLFLSDTMDIFLSGWQCPASPAVNPSG